MIPLRAPSFHAFATFVFLALFLALFVGPSAVGGQIEWRADAAAAFDEAKRDGKVVFVAINMDGERANDEMVKSHYKDSTIGKLAAQSVALFASKHDHESGSGACSRAGVVSCDAHRAAEMEVRKRYLESQGEAVIAPQHLWIGPGGKLLLSVPYKISVSEMEWCFTEAFTTADPAYKGVRNGRAPRRLIVGGVTANVLEVGQEPPTKKEVKALIEELRKERRPWDRRGDVLKIFLSDDKAALDFAKTVLTSRSGGRRGGGRENSGQWKRELVHEIGRVSPTAYWKVIASLIGDSDAALRAEVAVALEQLAEPKALSDLLKALSKEEEFDVRKELVRAIGVCGCDSSKAAKLVTRDALKAKDPEIRPYAMVATASLNDAGAVDKTVRSGLMAPESDVRAAAGWVVAIRRDAELRGALETAIESETDADVRAALEAALGVLGGGEAGPLDAVLRDAAGSAIARDRV